jgi:hypothetical protein
MTGFDLLKRDKKLFLTNNLFSVPCILSNGAETEETRCIGNFIGLQIITDKSSNSNSIAVINDTCEACMSCDDITIGKVKENWTLSFRQGGTDETINFRIDNVIEDRTTGVYRLKLSLLKKEANVNNSNGGNNSNYKPIIRRNGGI